MTGLTSRPGGPRRPPNRRSGRHSAGAGHLRPVGKTTSLESELTKARALLSAFVEQRADLAADELGFGWTPAPDAPSTWPDLLDAFALSEDTGVPLPVSNQFCDNTVYLSPKTNMAFRFWHDSSHVRFGFSFELVDELELAGRHLTDLEKHGGVQRGSLPWRMLHADLVGQIYVMALARRFPVEQWPFVRSVFDLGFDRAVLEECRYGPAQHGTGISP